jgi:cytidylate kinase
MDRTIVTVDGLSGSGKTTLSALLADRLGFIHFNSGVLYRALGYLVLASGISPDDQQGVCRLMDDHTLELKLKDDKRTVAYLDRQEVTSFLYSPEVSESTSKLSQHQKVRQRLLQMQREAFMGQSMVAEGRDMGTVVFPEARVKFFITAKASVRASRRLSELKENSKSKGLHEQLNLEDKLKIEIEERDLRDSTRAASPTIPAPGAVIIDNSEQTLTKTLESMYDTVLKSIPEDLA